jgi:hypothetical protein
MLMFFSGGIAFGVPSLIAYGVFMVILDVKAETRLSPIQRVLASAILTGIAAFAAGYFWR